jgi:hypothetical protein
MRICRVKIIHILYTTFLLLLNVAHNTMCKKNGAILEFMLFPDILEIRTKFTGSTHVTFSMALRQGRYKLY